MTEHGEKAGTAGAPWTLDCWFTTRPRAALVFFYWPDTKDHRGYASGKANEDLWFSEDVACVSRAFNCYRVDAKSAPKEALEFWNVKQVPAILILDADRNRVASLDHFTSERAMVAFLQETLKAKFPDRWKQFQDGLKEIDKAFAEGKVATQKQDFETARDRLAFVVGNPFRTQDYPRAKELLAKASKQLGKER